MPRSLEIVLTLLLLLVFSPLMVLISLAIKLDTAGPVLYQAKRVGQNGRIFNMLKFRTMVVGATEIGPVITTRGDSRLTRVGRWLRQAKVDELPQFINVLHGEMRLVGHRPEAPEIVARYTKTEQRILHYKPGITSRASLRFGSEEAHLSANNWEEEYLGDILPGKIAAELIDRQKATVWSELGVIAITLRSMLPF